MLRKAIVTGHSGFVVPVLSKYQEGKSFKATQLAVASDTSAGGQYSAVYCGNAGLKDRGCCTELPKTANWSTVEVGHLRPEASAVPSRGPRYRKNLAKNLAKLSKT